MGTISCDVRTAFISNSDASCYDGCGGGCSCSRSSGYWFADARDNLEPAVYRAEPESSLPQPVPLFFSPHLASFVTEPLQIIHVRRPWICKNTCVERTAMGPFFFSDPEILSWSD